MKMAIGSKLCNRNIKKVVLIGVVPAVLLYMLLSASAFHLSTRTISIIHSAPKNSLLRVPKSAECESNLLTRDENNKQQNYIESKSNLEKLVTKLSDKLEPESDRDDLGIPDTEEDHSENIVTEPQYKLVDDEPEYESRDVKPSDLSVNLTNFTNQPIVTPKDYYEALKHRLNTTQLFTRCQFLTGKFINPRTVVEDFSGFQTEDCRLICYHRGKIWAIVHHGRCYCDDRSPGRPFVDMNSCRYKCTEQPCNIDRLSHILLMKTQTPDGVDDWTTWMRIHDKHFLVRYRSCRKRTSGDELVCNPEYQKFSLNGVSPTDHDVLSSYLGCFAGISFYSPWMKKSSKAVQEVLAKKQYRSGTRMYKYCYDYCRTKPQAKYAALTAQPTGQMRTCYCVTTLRLSQPVGTCEGGSGLQVFSTVTKTKPSNQAIPAVQFIYDTHQLTFWNPDSISKTRILLIARYRSGSSMTQSFFVRNSLTYSDFEPEKYQLSEDYPSDEAVLQNMEGMLRCDLSQFAPAFSYPGRLRWSLNMLNIRGADGYNLQRFVQCSPYWSTQDCAAYLKEVCDLSSMINIKTIKIKNPHAVSGFIKRNYQHIHVIHLVRDPKGLIGAQRRFGTKRDSYDLCQEVYHMGEMFHSYMRSGYKNVHEVFYEQLAINSSYYGDLMYKELGLGMSEAQRTFLSHQQVNTTNITSGEKQVIRSNPESNTLNFLVRNPITRLLDIDKSCSQVYKIYHDNYQTIKQLYNNNPELVLKYSSRQNIEWIKNQEKDQLQT